jgi:tetratricopeptide (TPR) repeat protein
VDRPLRFVRTVALALAMIAPGAACERGPAPPDLSALPPLDPDVRSLIGELAHAIAAGRSDAARWGRLGMAFEANGLQPQAEQAYATAAKLDPAEPRWHYRLALLRAHRGDLDAALADLDRAIARDAAYAPARWRQGQWRFDRGDLPGAEAAYRAALTLSAVDPAATIGLAQVHLARREDAEAAAILERLVRIAPDESYAHHLLGTAYQRLGRVDEARSAQAIGRSKEPTWIDPWSDEIGQYRRGFAAQLKEATALGLARRFDEAIAILERLRAGRPDDRPLEIYLGGMFASAGRVPEAVAILEPIVNADPAQFDAWMHLASAHLFAGSLDRAAVAAGRALSLRPDSAAAARLQGVIDWQRGLNDAALAAFAASAEADPRDPMPHLWTGMIRGQQGRYLEARQAFEAALARDPRLADALIGVADTYAALGDLAAARAALARAERAAPDSPRLADARQRIAAAGKATR